MNVNIISKIPTGIRGFDEISYGGIPKGRITLVSGTTGSGKTVFASSFLYNGAVKYNDGCVYVSFEERPEDILRNMKSLGMNFSPLIKKGNFVFIDASKQIGEQTEVGTYRLDALIARTIYGITKTKATRLAMDSISALFERFESRVAVRNGLYELAVQLKSMGITTLLTSERREEKGEHPSVGPAEFVADNVILLHSFMEAEKRKRTIEILKCRGADYDSTEARLMIDAMGLEIFPRPQIFLSTGTSNAKEQTGITGLDKMLYGGLYQKSTTLISGASGTGKTITAIKFVLEGAMKGQKGLFFAFEESKEQLIRNAESFGWPLEKYLKNGKVKIVSNIAELTPIEKQYKVITEHVKKMKPTRFVLDSLSGFERIYETDKFREFTVGLNNFLKNERVTSIITNTTASLLSLESATETHLSTATDNIIILKYVELGGEMRRLISVLKQRGSMHNKELMEFEITPEKGIHVIGPFTGVENLLSGSAKRIEIRFDESEAERAFLEESRRGTL